MLQENRVRHDFAGPGPYPTVVLPQTTPTPFTHGSNPNPSSSIPSFTARVTPSFKGCLPLSPVPRSLTHPRPPIHLRPLIQPRPLLRRRFPFKHLPTCMGVDLSRSPRFPRSPPASPFLRRMPPLSPVPRSHTHPCPPIPLRPLIWPRPLLRCWFPLKHLPTRMGVDSSRSPRFPRSPPVSPFLRGIPPIIPSPPNHIPILAPRYPRGLSFGLDLFCIVGFISNTDAHWHGLVKIALAESSLVGAPVIPHGHGTISTSAKPKTVTPAVAPSTAHPQKPKDRSQSICLCDAGSLVNSTTDYYLFFYFNLFSFLCESMPHVRYMSLLRAVRQIIKLRLPTWVYISTQKKLACERGRTRRTRLLKIDGHVVKCHDREKNEIDKTLRWTSTFPTSLGTPLNLNCTTFHDRGRPVQD